MKSLVLLVGAPKSHAVSNLHSTLYPRSSSEPRHWLKCSPFLSWMGMPARSPSSCSGPHSMNSRTFSTMMMEGLTSSAQRVTTWARARIFFSFGLPPFAREKCVQSGLAQSRYTFFPRVTSRGRVFHTSSGRCSVWGWLSSWTRIASSSWLRATSGSRPSAAAMPQLAPPHPAKRSTIRPLAGVTRAPRRALGPWCRCLSFTSVPP